MPEEIGLFTIWEERRIIEIRAGAGRNRRQSYTPQQGGGNGQGGSQPPPAPTGTRYYIASAATLVPHATAADVPAPHEDEGASGDITLPAFSEAGGRYIYIGVTASAADLEAAQQLNAQDELIPLTRTTQFTKLAGTSTESGASVEWWRTNTVWLPVRSGTKWRLSLVGA